MITFPEIIMVCIFVFYSFCICSTLVWCFFGFCYFIFTDTFVRNLEYFKYNNNQNYIDRKNVNQSQPLQSKSIQISKALSIASNVSFLTDIIYTFWINHVSFLMVIFMLSTFHFFFFFFF